MRKTAKTIVQILLFFVSLAAVMAVCNRVLMIKSEDGVNQNRALYYQPEESIDVLFMGSSHIHCNVDTGALWEEFGIAGYDYSAAEQPLWVTYYWLEEALKTQSPKVVVLDLFSPARFKDDYHYKWIEESIHGMNPSSVKVEMVKTAVEPGQELEYLPSAASYHARWSDPDKRDISYILGAGFLKNFKGYTPRLETTVLERPADEVFDEDKAEALAIAALLEEKEESRESADRTEGTGSADGTDSREVTDEEAEETVIGLTEKSREYLEKIIDLCNEQRIQLMLISSPYQITAGDMVTYSEIRTIADERNIPFINYNEQYDALGLDFAEHFSDFSHLNYKGSRIFTEQLGKDLIENYSLADHRGEAGYESWDQFAAEVREETEGQG